MNGHVRALDVVAEKKNRWRTAGGLAGLVLGTVVLLGAMGQDLPSRVAPAAPVAVQTAEAPRAESRRPHPAMSSRAYVVVDNATGDVLMARNADEPRSIASITKLISAMVYLDLSPDLEEVVEITREDRRGARPAHTRLQNGYKLSSSDLLHAALVSSENPAIEALARSLGLSRTEFVGMMNRKAQALGMTHSIFFDASGLDSANTASALDVVRMLQAAAGYPLIQEISTTQTWEAKVVNGGRRIQYWNSNRLARSSSWSVVTGKTGYTSDAGHCLAVTARTASGRELSMVFLGASGPSGRFGDAAKAVAWVEDGDAVAVND